MAKREPNEAECRAIRDHVFRCRSTADRTADIYSAALRNGVRQLQAMGFTYGDIGAILVITRQRAQQLGAKPRRRK